MMWRWALALPSPCSYRYNPMFGILSHHVSAIFLVRIFVVAYLTIGACYRAIRVKPSQDLVRTRSESGP